MKTVLKTIKDPAFAGVIFCLFIIATFPVPAFAMAEQEISADSGKTTTSSVSANDRRIYKCKDLESSSWNEAEKWVWNQVCLGENADLEKWKKPKDNVCCCCKRHLLTPQFLKTILLEEPWKSAITHKGVRITCVRFNDPIDLEGSHIEHDLFFENLLLEESVNFSRAKLRSLSFKNSIFNKSVKMDEANIENSLWFNSSKFKNILQMTSIEVKGHLGMQKVNFYGKEYKCSTLSNINVCLIGAKIEGQLIMQEATFSDSIIMQSIKVGEKLFLRGSVFQKDVWLIHSEIKNSLILASSTGDEVLEAKWEKDSVLYLTDTKVGSVTSTQQKENGPFPQKTKLDGFEYKRLYEANGKRNKKSTKSKKWYTVDWLKRISEADDYTYSPQPYKQLAKTLKNMGLEPEATAVLSENERMDRKNTCKNHLSSNCLSKWFRYLLIGSGFGSDLLFRPLFCVGLLTLLTAFLLRKNKDSILKAETKFPEKVNTDDWLFYFGYSLDRLLPIIHLRQRYYDEIDIKGKIRYWFYFVQLVGYVLVFFFISGLGNFLNF